MAARTKRLAVILGVGGFLVLGAVLYLQYFLARPVGTGPAGPVVDKTAFAQPWSKKTVWLIGIGDSITAGLGADTPDRSYFARLVKNPANEFPDMQGGCLSQVLPNLRYNNLAVSGSTSKNHLAVIEERLDTHGADEFGLVVITTGGNDIIHNYGRSAPRECAMYGATLAQAEPWIEAYRERLETMLKKIQASFPGGCEIYLGDIYDPTDGVGDAPSVYLPHWPDGLAIHGRYNTIILECAARHSNVHVVPLHKAFLGHGAHCRQFWRQTYDAADPHYWFYDNIEDPNDRGYDVIRRLFLNSILENSRLSTKAG